MPRGKGHPKTGGHQKGTPNKIRVKTREALWAYVEREAQRDAMAHPVTLLVSIMTSPPPTEHRLAAATALLDRMLPRLKAVEISGDSDAPSDLDGH